MAYNFHPVDREQMYLMPPCLRDWLPEDDLVWFVIDAVKQICSSLPARPFTPGSPLRRAQKCGAEGYTRRRSRLSQLW